MFGNKLFLFAVGPITELTPSGQEVRARVLLCGRHSVGKKTLARLMRQLPGGSQLRIEILDTSDPASAALRLATAALVANAGIVLVDSSAGPDRHTLWHLQMLVRLGVPTVVLALNKCELAAHLRPVFEAAHEHCAEAAALGTDAAVVCVPISALGGINVIEPAEGMSWYSGKSLMSYVVSNLTDERQADEAVADQFEATVVWGSQRPLLQGRSYPMKVGETLVSATLSPLKHRVDPDTMRPAPAKTLRFGDLGVCNLELDRSIAFASRQSFVLFEEPHDSEPAGVGRLHFALRRSQNLRWQALDIDKAARAASLGQRPCVVWFTGLSGAGKSTIANLVERQLHTRGRHTYLLDGDNVRHGLNKDLGFTDADRVENIRRVAEVARLMADAGLIVLVSFISPFRSERRMARALVEEREFLEVFVDAPLAVAEARDPKGLYKKARRGELKNFTGVDSPYEAPEHAEIRLDTTQLSPLDGAHAVIQHLERTGVLVSKVSPSDA